MIIIIIEVGKIEDEKNMRGGLLKYPEEGTF